eukprot:15667-Heterococcus_DN1.PRE.3
MALTNDNHCSFTRRQCLFAHMHSEPFQSAKMRLYGLFKTVTCGKCDVPKPAKPMVILGEDLQRAKWEAWMQASTFTSREAMSIYIGLAAEVVHACTAAQTSTGSAAGTSTPTSTPGKSLKGDTPPAVANTNSASSSHAAAAVDDSAATAAAAANTSTSSSTTAVLAATDAAPLPPAVAVAVAIESSEGVTAAATEAALEIARLNSRTKELEEYLKHMQEASQGGLDSDLVDLVQSGWLYKWRDSMYQTEKHSTPMSQMSLKQCVLKDEGTRQGRYNKLTKTVPQYHIFGLYLAGSGQRGPNAGVLLRLSTDNEEAAQGWMTALSQACSVPQDAAIDTAVDGATTDTTTTTGAAASATDSDATASGSGDRQAQGLSRQSSFSASQRGMRQRSRSARNMSVTGLSVTGATVTAPPPVKIKKFNPASYPASKIMHKDVQPSLLSDESPQQNYRGFMNLIAYGVVIEVPVLSTTSFSDWPCLSGTLALNLHMLAAFAIEYMSRPTAQNKRPLAESTIIKLHAINLIIELCVPVYVVWQYTGSPMFGFQYLFTATVLWMKLISYAHCNRDVRLAWHEAATAKQKEQLQQQQQQQQQQQYTTHANHDSKHSGSSSSKASPPRIRMSPTLRSGAYMCGRMIVLYSTPLEALTDSMTLTIKRTRATMTMLTVLMHRHMTTVNPLITMTVVVAESILMLIAGNMQQLLTIILQQYIMPALQSSFHPVTAGDLITTLETLLALSIPSTYICFGDRVFYKDWWNAGTIDTYWRLWNIPFYAFTGMLFNILLVPLTKAIENHFGKGSQAGNWIFWTIFCIVGQPMSVLVSVVKACNVAAAGTA